MAQQRRRRRILGATAALLVAVGTAVSLASVTETELADAAIGRAQSFMDLLGSRSPGTRTEAQLTKMRAGRRLISTAAPPEDVQVNLTRALAPPGREIAIVGIDVAAPIPELPARAWPRTPAMVFGPGGGGGSPGTGEGAPGGGGGPPGTGSPPATTFARVPAVPEPGTWMTMLFGFGLIGWDLRRGKRLRVARISS